MAAQDLERIERELEEVGAGYEAARLLNRAGDLHLVQEDREGALRRTLAWLCLWKGFLEIAREHIDAYVQASIEADLQSLATQQLQLMAQYVDKAHFREFLAGKLEDLGDEAGGQARARGRRHRHRSRGRLGHGRVCCDAHTWGAAPGCG